MPDWLLNEHAITLATWGLVFVTLLLVIVTFVLWLDSLKKGKEQRVRWELEDEQHSNDRAEERARWKREDDLIQDGKRPKLAFGVELGAWNPAHFRTIGMWCTNLGLVAFQVQDVFLRHAIELDGEPDIREFHPFRVVKPGEQVQIAIPNEVFDHFLFTTDLEMWVSVVTGDLKTVSSVAAYSFFFAENQRVHKVRQGYHESRKVPCLSCGATGFFEPNGLTTKVELEEQIASAQAELSSSCPDHSSKLLRSVVSTQGIVKRFEKNA